MKLPARDSARGSLLTSVCQIQGEGPAVEEKPALSLLDKIRGKRHSSSDQPSPSPNTPGKRASFDSGQACRESAVAHLQAVQDTVQLGKQETPSEACYQITATCGCLDQSALQSWTQLLYSYCTATVQLLYSYRRSLPYQCAAS